MQEIWKDIPGYEGYYQASDLGRIRSVSRKLCNGKGKRGKIITAIPDCNGYYRIFLYKDRKKQRYMVHRLIAYSFIDNPSGYTMINHKDEDKSNNSVSNLEWCDCKYNINYGSRTKRASGDNTKNSKLTSEIIKKIRKQYIPKDKTFGAKALSIKYGVSVSAILRAALHKSWKYVE